MNGQIFFLSINLIVESFHEKLRRGLVVLALKLASS